MRDYILEETFSFCKNDNNWLKKLIIGTGISLLALIIMLTPIILAFASKTFNFSIVLQIILGIFLAFILACAVNGFCIKAAHERIHDRNAKLPEWNEFWTFVFIGFKCFVGSTLFYIPYLAIGFVIVIFDGILQSNGSSTIKDNLIFINYLYQALYFLFLLFYFAFNANFIIDYKISSYINAVKAYKRIKDCVLSYVILVILIFAFGCILNIISLVLFLTIIGIFVLPFIWIFLNLITLDLTVQFLNITEKKQIEK